MNDFLSPVYNGQPMVTFSGVHLAALAVLAAMNFLLIGALVKSGSRKAAGITRYAIAFFLLFNEGCYQIWSAANGFWRLDYTLPLHLCDAAMIISVLMLLTGRRFFYEVAYFWGLGGSLQALLTPDIYPYSFPHFIYFNFFLAHGVIITAVLYMTYIEGYRPKARSMLRTILFTNAYMAVIAAVDILTGGNYMFLCHKPATASLIDLLGPWPWYIAGLEAVGAVMIFILYLPYLIRDSLNKSTPRGFTA